MWTALFFGHSCAMLIEAFKRSFGQYLIRLRTGERMDSPNCQRGFPASRLLFDCSFKGLLEQQFVQSHQTHLGRRLDLEQGLYFLLGIDICLLNGLLNLVRRGGFGKCFEAPNSHFSFSLGLGAFFSPLNLRFPRFGQRTGFSEKLKTVFDSLGSFRSHRLPLGVWRLHSLSVGLGLSREE